MEASPACRGPTSAPAPPIRLGGTHGSSFCRSPDLVTQVGCPAPRQVPPRDARARAQDHAHRNDLDGLVRLVADGSRFKLKGEAFGEVKGVGDEVREVLVVEATAWRTREGRDLAGGTAVRDDVRVKLQVYGGQAVVVQSRGKGKGAPLLSALARWYRG